MLVVLALCAVPALTLHAQSQNTGMTFTVTPPLFQLGLTPSETWTSAIRVVNNNPYDITIYAEAVGFRATGETGRPQFLDTTLALGGNREPDQSTLVGWLTLPQGAITIPREQTYSLPVAITVPPDAAPGGHYAAVLIGNTPPATGGQSSELAVSSSIASLFMLRVAGDVLEEGRIREFSTNRSFYEEAHAKLRLRFENRGNVHLQPQGDITIYNMWGKERGYIPVNQARGYGSVLPGSVREFAFTWSSEHGLWDVGRYRAEATIGYGGEKKTFVQSTTYFWVLPILPLMQIAAALLFMLWFLTWALRAYIRHAVHMERSRAGLVDESENAEDVAVEGAGGLEQNTTQSEHVSVQTLMRPIRHGMVDLRHGGVGGGDAVKCTDVDAAPHHRVRAFLRHYRNFFVFLFAALVCVGIVVAFIHDVRLEERLYEVTEEVPAHPTQ